MEEKKQQGEEKQNGGKIDWAAILLIAFLKLVLGALAFYVPWDTFSQRCLLSCLAA